MNIAESGQKARIILKNGFHYSGLIIEATDKNIILLDKYNKKVVLAIDSIMTLEVF